jgi:hypothetical protein
MEGDLNIWNQDLIKQYLLSKPGHVSIMILCVSYISMFNLFFRYKGVLKYETRSKKEPVRQPDYKSALNCEYVASR